MKLFLFQEPTVAFWIRLLMPSEWVLRSAPKDVKLDTLIHEDGRYCFLAGSGISLDPPSCFPTGYQAAHCCAAAPRVSVASSSPSMCPPLGDSPRTGWLFVVPRIFHLDRPRS